MNNLASLLKASSWAFPGLRPKGAIMPEVLRRAVEHDDPYPGPHNLGTKWQARGSYDSYEEAEPLYQKVLEVRHGLRAVAQDLRVLGSITCAVKIRSVSLGWQRCG